MNFYEMLRKRESCRNFDPERIPTREQLMRICEAGRLSPSACNTQPWRYYIVDEPETAAKLAKCTQSMNMNKFASECPTFIVICDQPLKYEKKTRDFFVRYKYSDIDIGISTMNLCYAAMEEGLSTCILGWFDERRIMRLLGLKRDRRVKLVLCVGYAKTDKLRSKKRRPIEEIVDNIEKEDDRDDDRLQ